MRASVSKEQKESRSPSQSWSPQTTWHRQPEQPGWAGCLEETAEAVGVPATEAVQPVAAEEAGLDGKVEAAGAEEVGVENLPPVHHKA